MNKPAESTPKPIAARDLVLVALKMLDGETEFVSTEDIAFECFSRFPDRFSWIQPKYSHFPDKLPVVFALHSFNRKGSFHNGKPLVTGRLGAGTKSKRGDGWRITAAGVDYLAANDLIRRTEQREVTIPLRSSSAEEASLRRSTAWKLFIREGSLDSVSATDVRDLIEFPRSGSDAAFGDELRIWILKMKRSQSAAVLSFVGLLNERWGGVAERRDKKVATS